MPHISSVLSSILPAAGSPVIPTAKATTTTTLPGAFRLGRPAGQRFFTMSDISDEVMAAVTKARSIDALVAFWRCLDRQRVAGRTKAIRDAAEAGRLLCGIRGMAKSCGMKSVAAMRRQVAVLERLRLVSVMRQHPDAPGRKRPNVITWVATEADMRPRTKADAEAREAAVRPAEAEPPRGTRRPRKAAAAGRATEGMGSGDTHTGQAYRVGSLPTSQYSQDSLEKEPENTPQGGGLTAEEGRLSPAGHEGDESAAEPAMAVTLATATTTVLPAEAEAGTPCTTSPPSRQRSGSERPHPLPGTRRGSGGRPARQWTPAEDAAFEAGVALVQEALEAARKAQQQREASEAAGRREAARSRSDALREQWRLERVRGAG